MNDNSLMPRRHSLFTTILTLLFTATLFVLQSCRKSEIVNGSKSNYAEKFFEKPAGSNTAVQAIIDLLKKENDKTGFINSLPENTGLPVWSKLVAEKQKANDAARGIIIDKEGNYLIPLSNDNKTLSALLFAIKKDGKYEFYCYDNNYAYGIAFSNACNIKDKEKVMGLFMGMSNYVFGLSKFKNIPKEIFEGFESKPEENGDTKKVFLKLAEGTLPDIFINDVFIPVTYRKCFWEFTGTCNCNGSNNTPENCDHPNSECPTGTCTKEVCYTFIELGNGPGANPPSSTPNTGTGVPPTTNSNSNWSNNFGSPLPGSDPTNLPNAPCNNNCSWFTEAPEYEFEQGIDLGDHGIDDVITEFSDLGDPNTPDKPVINNGIDVVDTQNPQQGGGQILGRTTNRQNTEDLTYGTNGNPSGLVQHLINNTNDELFGTMTNLINTFSVGQLQDAGHDMINKFRTNTTTDYEYSNDWLNYFVGKSSDLENFVKVFGKRLIERLQTNPNIGNLPPIEMGLTRPVFNGAYNKFHGLQILINDTEYTEIKLVDSRSNGNQREVDLEITIYDHFGLDKADALVYQIYHWGFPSWWILQHMRNFIPYITKVVVYKTIKFTL